MSTVVYLRRKEAAALARVSPQTIDRWRREGKLASHRARVGTLFFLRSDVEDLVKPRREGR